MKVVKAFSNGRSLAVRIPRDWLGGAREVEMKRVADTIELRVGRTTLAELAAGWAADPVELERLPQSVTKPRPLGGR